MANTPVVVLDDTLTNIANAIRGKNGSSNKYKPGQMAGAIDNIPAGGLGIPREVIDGVYKIPEVTSFSLPSNATNVGKYALAYAFYSCPSLTSVDLSSLTKVSGEQALYRAFDGCTSLTSVDLSSLTTVNGDNALAYAFVDCTSLTSVDLSSLTTVDRQAVFKYAFSGCTKLTSVNFSSLANLVGQSSFRYAFYNCSSLASLSFPALKESSFKFEVSQFDSMLSGVTGCTIHFPAAIRAKIETLTGYPNFGGTNTTVLFDL